MPPRWRPKPVTLFGGSGSEPSRGEQVVPVGRVEFFRSSVNPTLASTRREAVFHSQTVAHRCSYPSVLAQSRTANEASVAYP